MGNVWARIFFTACLATGFPIAVFAAPNTALKAVYEGRVDLQSWFDAKTYAARSDAATETMSLEDWARQYGWREDKTLKAYAPTGLVPTAIVKTIETPAPDVTARGYTVIDQRTGLILAQKNAGITRPIASLTKLMTADVVLGRKTALNKMVTMRAGDAVGGSTLGLKVGNKLSVSDLFYAAFLPSANDATNMLAGATGLSRPKFVENMNERARSLGLVRTVFTDPTGIDEGNISTPREFAVLAQTIFRRPEVRRYATTVERTIRVLPRKIAKKVKNSNFILSRPEYEDLYVTAGKTGYLGPEIGWNIAVALHDGQRAVHPELLVVVFGTETLKQGSTEAADLARWSWEQYQWKNR